MIAVGRTLLLLLALVTLLISVRPAGATFVSIDLGGEFVKVAGPKGQAIDVLLNEQSNRKSPLYVGFRKGERFFSDDAKNLAARFPDLMIAAVSKYVGTSALDRAWLEDTVKNSFGFVTPVYAAPSATEDGSGDVPLAAFQFVDTESNTTAVYSAEALLGMFFTYIKGFAAAELEGPVRDAVVCVPAALPPRPRQAIIDAAALAGLRVFALMNGNTAAALALGLQNRGFDMTTPVVVLDVGSTHAEATLFRFDPPAAATEGGGRSKAGSMSGALGAITTLAVASDLTLGGRSFDQCIAQLLEDEYVDKARATAGFDEATLRVLGGATLASRRSAFSLLRAANKAKEVLSANQDVLLTVENISPDKDFSTRLTRLRLETTCAGQLTRIVALVDRLFSAEQTATHGLTKADVKRCELIGGASRVPKLADLLKAWLGRGIDRTLNSDEAAAVGAGYYGATLTGHFRLKSFALHELLPDSFSFTLDNVSTPGGAEPVASQPPTLKERMLFHAGNTSMPARRVVVLPNRTTNLVVGLLRNGVVDSVTEVGGVASAYDSVTSVIQSSLAPTPANETSGEGAAASDPAPSPAPTIPLEPSRFETRITVRLGESGLVYIEDATVVAQYHVLVSRLVPAPIVAAVPTTDPAAAAAAAVPPASAADDGSISSEETPDEPPAVSPDAKKSKKDSKLSAKDKLKQQQEEKKKTAPPPPPPMVRKLHKEFRERMFPLVLATSFAQPAVMTRAVASASREKLRLLNAADDARLELAAAKNDLEAYAIWAKTDWPSTEAGTGASAADAQGLATRVAEVQTWLEDYAEGATRDDFLEKLTGLKGVVRRMAKALQKDDSDDALATEGYTKNHAASASPSSTASSSSSSGATDDAPASPSTASDADESADSDGKAAEGDGDAAGEGAPSASSLDGSDDDNQPEQAQQEEPVAEEEEEEGSGEL